MSIEPLIGFPYQGPIKSLLAHAGFVAAAKKNGSAAGIEGEGDSPHPVRGVETQFFHIGVPGTVQ